MLCGHAPFFDDEDFSKYEKILTAHVEWPSLPIDSFSKDLVKRLLVIEPSKRLGNLHVSHGRAKTIDYTRS
jgi:hypothetical protein